MPPHSRERSVDADPSRYVSDFVIGVAAQRAGRCDDAIPAFRARHRSQAARAGRRGAQPARRARRLPGSLRATADGEHEFRAELADVPWSPEARVGLATLYRSQGSDVRGA